MGASRYRCKHCGQLTRGDDFPADQCTCGNYGYVPVEVASPGAPPPVPAEDVTENLGETWRDRPPLL